MNFIPPIDGALRIAEVFTRYRYGGSREGELQRELADVLAAEGVEATREVELGPRNRIDFLAGRVGVEVKVDGTLPEALRQVSRYLQRDEIDCVLLVSTRPWAAEMPGEVHDLYGKRVRVVRLNRSF